MLRPAITVILMLVVIGSVSVAQAVPPDVTIEELQAYKLRTDQLIGELRAEIRAVLPPELRIKERSVKYEVVINPSSVNSSITLQGHAPTVYMDSQLVEVFDWIAESLALDLRLQGQSCTAEYLTYLSSALNRMLQSSFEGLASPPALSPSQFFARRRDICPFDKLSALRVDSAVRIQRELFLRSSLKLVMAHEFAHVALGHLGKTNKSIDEIRQEESAADKFAVDNLALAGTDPAEAIPGSVLWMLLDRSGADNKYATHEPGERRVSLLIDAAQQAEFLNPQLTIAAEWEGMAPHWDKGTKAVIDKARQRVLIDALGANCPECARAYVNQHP